MAKRGVTIISDPSNPGYRYSKTVRQIDKDSEIYKRHRREMRANSLMKDLTDYQKGVIERLNSMSGTNKEASRMIRDEQSNINKAIKSTTTAMKKAQGLEKENLGRRLERLKQLKGLMSQSYKTEEGDTRYHHKMTRLDAMVEWVTKFKGADKLKQQRSMVVPLGGFNTEQSQIDDFFRSRSGFIMDAFENNIAFADLATEYEDAVRSYDSDQVRNVMNRAYKRYQDMETTGGSNSKINVPLR